MQSRAVIDVALSSSRATSASPRHRNSSYDPPGPYRAQELALFRGTLQQFAAGTNRNRTSAPGWLFTALRRPQKRAQTGRRNFIVPHGTGCKTLLLVWPRRKHALPRNRANGYYAVKRETPWTYHAEGKRGIRCKVERWSVLCAWKKKKEKGDFSAAVDTRPFPFFNYESRVRARWLRRSQFQRDEIVVWPVRYLFFNSRPRLRLRVKSDRQRGLLFIGS